MKFTIVTGSLFIIFFLSLLPFQHQVQPIAHNGDWSPIYAKFHRVEMVFVPAGCFSMGSNEDHIDRLIADCESVSNISECRSAWLVAESPAHPQCVDQPFWIDRYEITNAQAENFGVFLGYNAYSPLPECPYNGLTWYEARDFCAIRGMRLPTEVEWEYAARGPDNLIYTWGDSLTETTGQGEICPATPNAQAAQDSSWVGAWQMSSSLWEWVSSVFLPYPYDAKDGREDPKTGNLQRVLRGGSFQYLKMNVRHAAYRLSVLPLAGGNLWGVRCVAP